MTVQEITVQQLATDFDLKFSSDDMLAAHKEWKINCGPSALAAACGLTLDEVRPHLGQFEQRGYMSPTMMSEAIDSIGVQCCEITKSRKIARDAAPEVLPANGLARIQWTGPWTAPGSNGRWAYGQTHWIATKEIIVDGSFSRGFTVRHLVFDVNSGPVLYQDWDARVAPEIAKSIKRADCGWYFTHLWEIER